MTGSAWTAAFLIRAIATLIIGLGLLASLAATGPAISWQGSAALAGDDDDDDDGGDDDDGDDGDDDDDGDDNRGHGNDDDGDDEDNSGRGNRDDRDEDDNSGPGSRNQGKGKDGQVEPAADFVVEIACAFDATSVRTTCTFTGLGTAGGLRDIGVPAEAVCAEIVGGDYERGGFAGGAPPLSDGYSARPGRPDLVLMLDGEVVQGRPVTYWVATDAGTYPAGGPSLGCVTTASIEVAEPETTPPPALGAIEIWVFGCDGGQPLDPAAFDWYGRCQTPAVGATFRLSQRDGTTFEPIGEAAADAAGLVRFPELAPGAYKIEELGAVWCHAESNSVDERGEVVVVAGELATVWTFHCDQEVAAESP